MMGPVVPATLEFRDGVPYSAVYGDVYHSADGGAGQAHHVFLGGCGLPERWAGRADFVILETGFGTGMNFLATWAAWRADPRRPATLHVLSVEKHPFGRDDLACLHARWPEFAALSAELLAKWPLPVAGFHRIALAGGRVRLTLMFGDASDCLPQAEAGVDAFYLDGFAPDRNPDLWRPELIAILARLARPGALAATYSVAAPVRAALSRAGFVCEKRAGYGRKRHCLRALHPGRRAHASRPPQRVAVVGAGVAGSAVAHALAQRGVAVSVLERAPAPVTAASGNPVAVFRPVLSRDDTAATRLTRAAFLHDLRNWPELGEGLEWARCGVLHLARDATAAERQRQALAATAQPDGYARWVEVDEARGLANWPVEAPGVFYAQAGWAVPGGLCRAWLEPAGITLRTDCEVARLEAGSAGWRMFDAHDVELDTVDAVVLANAHDAGRLAPGAAWPLHSVRGQITRLPVGSLPGVQRVVAREGYFAPGVGQPLVGATYEHDDLDLAPRAASNLANLARLEAMLPGATAQIPAAGVNGRAALRATVPDRLPLLGAVDGAPGLYVAAAYASRGVVWAGLLGEALADVMTGAPLPLEKDLLAALDPGRFTRARRG